MNALRAPLTVFPDLKKDVCNFSLDRGRWLHRWNQCHKWFGLECADVLSTAIANHLVVHALTSVRRFSAMSDGTARSADTIPRNVRPFCKPPSGFIGICGERKWVVVLTSVYSRRDQSGHRYSAVRLPILAILAPRHIATGLCHVLATLAYGPAVVSRFRR